MSAKRILALLFLFSGGCTTGNWGSNTATTFTIQPGSAKALALALSLEDISILNEQDPLILKKIDKNKELSIEDIIKMHVVGISADAMILILEYTNTHLTLTTSDVIRLQIEGVPFKVINHMIRT